MQSSGRWSAEAQGFARIFWERGGIITTLFRNDMATAKQISDMIQNKSTASEESSATSQELSDEAETMDELIRGYKMKEYESFYWQLLLESI